MYPLFYLSFLIGTIALAAPLTTRACNDETLLHLSMANDFYKDSSTYQSESTSTDDTSASLGNAQWANLKHELDWITQNGPMTGCPRSARQPTTV